MRNYDFALGGVASGNNYLDVSGMDFIQYKELSSEHLTDARCASVLNSFHKLRTKKMPITSRCCTIMRSL